MTEHTANNEPTPTTGFDVYNPPSRLRLADGSVWGSEEITDLRNSLSQAKEQLDLSRQRSSGYINRIRTLESSVRDAFRELVEADDFDIEKANEYLESFGVDLIASEWEFEAVITVRGYAKAPNSSDVEEALADAGWSLDNYTSGVDDLEINEVEVSDVSTDRVVQ